MKINAGGEVLQQIDSTSAKTGQTAGVTAKELTVVRGNAEAIGGCRGRAQMASCMCRRDDKISAGRLPRRLDGAQLGPDTLIVARGGSRRAGKALIESSWPGASHLLKRSGPRLARRKSRQQQREVAHFAEDAQVSAREVWAGEPLLAQRTTPYRTAACEIFACQQIYTILKKKKPLSGRPGLYDGKSNQAPGGVVKQLPSDKPQGARRLIFVVLLIEQTQAEQMMSRISSVTRRNF